MCRWGLRRILPGGTRNILLAALSSYEDNLSEQGNTLRYGDSEEYMDIVGQIKEVGDLKKLMK